MKYIDVDQIRAEIGRLRDEYTDIAIDSHYGTVNANHVVDDLEQLLSFLDTLPEQSECHTVEDWMQHIKNADQLTKDIFSKGPYDVLYDALNHPFLHCYNAIKEFGELCFQTGVKSVKQKQPVEIHIDNPNIQKFDPNIKVETRTDGTGEIDGKAMLYVADKSYKIGFRDGKASKEQSMIRKSNALFDKCVENCDPAVMKEVSDNIDKMLGRQSVNGLEEAAEEYRRESYRKSVLPNIDGPMPEYGGSIKDAFIAGAEWGAEYLKK